jgi:tetratricopeptide (TPR) repeat protein
MEPERAVLSDEVVQAAVGGSRPALNITLEALARRVPAMVAARLSPTPHQWGAVDDIAQNVLLGLTKALPGLTHPTVAGLRALLSGIVTRQVARFLKRDPGGARVQPSVRSLDSTVASFSHSAAVGELLSGSGPSPHTAEGFYLRSFATLDIQQAKCDVTQAVQRDPRHALAWRRLVSLCVLKQDFDEALRAVQELGALWRDEGEQARLEGGVYLTWRKYDLAIDRYSRAIQIHPDDTSASCGRACARLCQRDYPGAVEDSTQEVIHNPASECHWPLFRRATALWAAGRGANAANDYREFRQQIRRASCADARLFLVLQDQARSLDQAGRTQDAQAARQEAEEVLKAARQSVSPESWLARIFDCLGDQLTPDKLVGCADRRDPARVCEAYYYAGEACLLRGKLDQAREFFEQCVATDLVLEPGKAMPLPMNEYHLARWRLDRWAGAGDTGSGPTADQGRARE